MVARREQLGEGIAGGGGRNREEMVLGMADFLVSGMGKSWPAPLVRLSLDLFIFSPGVVASTVPRMTGPFKEKGSARAQRRSSILATWVCDVVLSPTCQARYSKAQAANSCAQSRHFACNWTTVTPSSNAV